ncbi:GNAT family N-acetyltransferase [Embleya sp. NBC_00896]|uniref:GNAT family N-acetyltransferase n=1 Tax=Embleya sp. NBC_00896 TaxID=2975961 RepID=UPI0038654B76|nr:N-acetyltransferase [Embleya sp. NBC_00896]
MNIVVEDVPEQNRFEARIEGDLAGFADYMTTDTLIVFTHTEVEPKYEGKGVGGVLVRAALDRVRAGDRKVLPLCPFVKAWIGKHPDYFDLVYDAPPSTVRD